MAREESRVRARTVRALVLGGVLLVVSAASAQVARPRVLVARFVVEGPRVALSLAHRDGERSVVLANVDAPCVEEVGGLDSFAILTCGERRFELLQVGARVAIDEARGGQRVRRRYVARVPRGWTFVARCEQTIDDPLACPPAR
jgi:hypothetical protein